MSLDFKKWQKSEEIPFVSPYLNNKVLFLNLEIDFLRRFSLWRDGTTSGSHIFRLAATPRQLKSDLQEKCICSIARKDFPRCSAVAIGRGLVSICGMDRSERFFITKI